jgi:molecular chaperone GrpE
VTHWLKNAGGKVFDLGEFLIFYNTTMDHKDTNPSSDKSKRDKKESGESEDSNPQESVSYDDLLNKLENEAGEVEEQEESSDLLSKLGWSKKGGKKDSSEWKQKFDEVNDKYLRLHAEFDNYKKRTLKERMELSRTANSEVVSALLPVLDDFNRAMKQMETSNDLKSLADGVKLIQQKFTGILEGKGLKQMKSQGELFNPELHEAIAEIPAPDESMKGKVIDETEPGYYLNDKIIRHAKVVVGK